MALQVCRSVAFRRSSTLVRGYCSTSLRVWNHVTRKGEGAHQRCCYSTEESSPELSGRGIVVGCYDTGEGEGGGGGAGYELTECAKDIDLQTQGKLVHMINISGGKIRKGESRLFYDITADNAHVAVVGVGNKGCEKEETPDNLEDINVTRQNIRSAAAVGTKVLQKAQVKEVLVDSFEDAEAAAEGSMLSLFSFDKLKSEDTRKKLPTVKSLSSNPAHLGQWSRGSVLASAQSFARELMESPANHMTPTMFVEAVSKRIGDMRHTLKDPGCVQLVPRPLSWIESQKMGAFLGIAKGSSEPPWLLELRYNHPEGEREGREQPTVLVGKGVTFDTGGISIKPSAGMGLMRGDMGGAACVVATVMAVAQLECPASVVGLVPLCENMPSGNAVKPGDVVTSMNGTTIEVDNTDAEGRLLLADALCYAHSFNPKTIVDLATLTGAIDVALGTGAAAVFSNSSSLWTQLHKAGHMTGDRVWRMPLYSQYSDQMKSRLADINNVGIRGRSAGACTAAAFLKKFVEHNSWAHIDIAGVMESHGEVPYLDKGMTGRPTRTLVQFLEESAKG